MGAGGVVSAAPAVVKPKAAGASIDLPAGSRAFTVPWYAVAARSGEEGVNVATTPRADVTPAVAGEKVKTTEARSTARLNVTEIPALTATPVAPSAGETSVTSSGGALLKPPL